MRITHSDLGDAGCALLIQVGGITATLLNSTTTLDSWRKSIEPTQKLFAWAMNNHEETNYRAYQEGPVQFRFVVRAQRQPHNDAEAAQLCHGLQSAARGRPCPRSRARG